MKRFTKNSSMLLLLLMTAWTTVMGQTIIEPPFDETSALQASEITDGKKIALWALNGDPSRWVTRVDNGNNKRSNTFSKSCVFIVENADESGTQIVLKRYTDNKYMQSNNGIQWSENKSDAVRFTAAHPGENFDYTDSYLNPAPSWDPGYQTYLVRFTNAETGAFLNGNDNTGFAGGTGSWSAFLIKEVTEEDLMPFKYSDAPANDQFATNTYWYYLKLNDRYLSFNDVTENYNYSGTNNKEQKYVYSYTSNPLNYGCFWAFVKEGNDLKIYNAATGTSMVLASQGSEEREFYPTMMAIGSEGYTDIWHFKVAQDATKFYLFLQGTGTYENTENKLNCYGAAGEGNPKNYLTFSIGAGAWSYFTVEAVDVTAAINSVKENQAATTGAVGTLVADDYANFTEALEKGNMEGLVEALRIRDLTGNKISFRPNATYRLLTLGRDKGYMTMMKDFVGGDNLNNSNASQIWKLEGNQENGYTLYSQGAYMTAHNTLYDPYIPTTDIKSAAQFQLIPVGNYASKFYFDPVQEGRNIHLDNELKIVGWNDGAPSEWYIIPATDIDVTITDAGYATINYPFAVELPAGLTAYTGTVDGSKVMLNEVNGNIIPANSPVILSGATKTYTLTILADNAEDALTSNLQGTCLPKAIDTEATAYVLAKPTEKEVGFYLLESGEGADRTIAANKAYLVAPAEASGIKAFTFDFGGTTGIENTEALTEAEEYYDLQGRRVQNPTKGIYVTKSGKKVLFTK